MPHPTQLKTAGRRSRFFQELGLSNPWPELLGGSVVALMTSLLAASFSALVFSGDLAGWAPYGISLVLLSAVLISGIQGENKFNCAMKIFVPAKRTKILGR